MLLLASTLIDMNDCSGQGERTRKFEIEQIDQSPGKECLYKWVSLNVDIVL